MPDLSTNAVKSWFAEAAPGLSHLEKHGLRAIEEGESVAAALDRLGIVLETARAYDAAALDARLAADPARAALRSIIAQLGIHRMVRLGDWLAESPEGYRLLTALLGADDRGNGQTIRTTILELNRQTTIARMFAADRIETLLSACAIAFREPAT